MDEKENDIEIEINQNIISNNKRNIKKRANNNENFGQLTREQFELMKKIREETITRTERYSELVSSNKSNDELIATESFKKKKLKLEDTKKKPNKTEKKNISNNSLDIKDINETKEKGEIQPNKERIFKSTQTFLFYDGEPLIVIGPDAKYYVFIFSLISFLCIIIYSLKKPFIFLRCLFVISYLFFAITYTLLLILNPGIPTNKKNMDPTILQADYKQCNDCNCIYLEKEGKYTIHCGECNICVENFDHHCTIASKCIGKKNKIIFKMWLYSVPILFLISFLYLIF